MPIGRLMAMVKKAVIRLTRAADIHSTLLKNASYQ